MMTAHVILVLVHGRMKASHMHSNVFGVTPWPSASSSAPRLLLTHLVMADSATMPSSSLCDLGVKAKV